MIKRHAARWTARALAACLLLACCAITWAEVSVDTAVNDRPRTLIMLRDITDGIDPIPQIVWEPFRPLPLGRLLNIDGEIRPDGAPDVSWHPTSAWPTAVWAYNNGTDHDIAFSRWAGTQWTATEFLTASSDDELDPQVFVARNGAVHVVWWVDSNDPRVSIVTRVNADTFFTAAQRVTPTGVAGRRPTVVVFDDAVRVAYERDTEIDVTNAQEIVILVREPGDVWTEEHVIGTPRTAPLMPKFRVSGDVLRLSWQHSATHHAYVEFQDPGWSGIHQIAWDDESWIGIETARKLVSNGTTTPVGTVGEEEPGEGGSTSP